MSFEAGQLEKVGDDGSEGSEQHFGNNNNNHDGEDAAVQEIKRMAQRETRGARRWKIFVLLSMIVTGGLISVGTKHYLQQEENDDYTQSVSATWSHILLAWFLAIAIGLSSGHLRRLISELTLVDSSRYTVLAICFFHQRSRRRTC